MTERPSTIDCRTAMRQLYDYLDGELSEERAALIGEHLDQCQECFAHAGFERELLDVISGGWRNVVASAALRQRIRSELRNAGFGV